MAYILEHVGLGTSQETYEPTVRFYETVFGWHRIRELEGELTFLGDGTAAASRSSQQFDHPLQSDPPGFSVPLGRVRRRLQAGRGGRRTLDKPYMNEFDDKIGYFTDPAGNRAQIVARSKALER